MKNKIKYNEVKCECGMSIWGRGKTPCLKCGKVYDLGDPYNKAPTSKGKHITGYVANSDAGDTYSVPRGYQNWHAGYGFRRRFEENARPERVQEVAMPEMTGKDGEKKSILGELI